MLRKLLKHEFRSTARVMLPVLASILVLAVMSGLASLVIDRCDSVYWVAELFLRTIRLSFGASLFAVCVLAAALAIQRFYKSLLTDEGYLSWTLPVTADGHIFSKLLVSTAWIFAVGVFCVLAAALASAIGSGFREISFSLGLFEASGDRFGALRTLTFSTASISLLVLACFAVCLHFYAAMAVGASAANKKKLLSVVAYFVLGAIRNALGLFGAITAAKIAGRILPGLPELELELDSAEAAGWAVFTVCAGILLALSAGYYFITRAYLRRKLNLN